jgi:hypothetical protein
MAGCGASREELNETGGRVGLEDDTCRERAENQAAIQDQPFHEYLPNRASLDEN